MVMNVELIGERVTEGIFFSRRVTSGGRSEEQNINIASYRYVFKRVRADPSSTLSRTVAYFSTLMRYREDDDDNR